MKALENRTLDSKIEMDIIEALDEIRALNARNQKITSDTLLEHHKRTYEGMQRRFEADDEDAVRSVMFKNSTGFIKRIEDDEEGLLPAPKVVKHEDTSDFIKVLPLPEAKKAETAPTKKNTITPAIKIVPIKKTKAAQGGPKQGKPAAVKPKEQTPMSLVDY